MGFNILDKEFIYKGNDGTIRKYNVNKGSDEIFVNSEILVNGNLKKIPIINYN